MDPVEGKVGGSQGWNRYSYVLNRPLNLIDPTGMDAETTCDANNNCVTRVRSEIVRDPNDPDQVAAATAFKNEAESYWNNQTATGPNGEAITFDVQLSLVDPGADNPATDTLTVVSGQGRSHVDMRMARGRAIPDAGEIFTQDNSNNPSGMSGIAPHETGHHMGLRDLYVPNQAVPYVPGPQGEIMLHAQQGNQAGSAGQVANATGNMNVTVIRPQTPTPIPPTPTAVP